MRKKNQKQRIAIIFFAMIIIFIVLILFSHFDFIPALSILPNKLDKLELFALPKQLNFLIYLSPLVIAFFIIFFILRIRKDYTEEIKDSIKKTKDDIIKEYCNNLTIISEEQLVIQLEQRKILLIDELKQKYGHDSKNAEKIKDCVEVEWKEIEDKLLVQKNSENEKSSDNLKNENNVNTTEKVLSFQEEIGSSNKKVDDDSVFYEELEEPEIINPLEVISELEELDVSDDDSAKDFNILEELQNVDDNLEELEEPNCLEDIKESKKLEASLNELESVENIEEIDEMEEAEELEELEELAEVESKDPYPELVSNQNEKTVYTADNNTTFISETDEGFASVDNIFAEDLCIGTEYFHTIDSFDNDFRFMPVKLEFFLDKNIDEPLPIEEEKCFSLTRFNDKQPDFVELEEDYSSTIIEVEGVFSISDNLSYENVQQDQDFKNLVNSVLR